MPRFKDIIFLAADKNLSKTALKFSPIGPLLGVILDTFYSDLGSRLIR